MHVGTNNTALIIVDVQPTFTEGGELAVEGGNAVAERIHGFTERNRSRYALIATTQDWHVEPGEHWSDHPDFVDTWPVHGAAGTPNARLHPAVESLGVPHHIKKGQYSAAYSGFEGVEDNGEAIPTRDDVAEAAARLTRCSPAQASRASTLWVSRCRTVCATPRSMRRRAAMMCACTPT